LRAVEILPGILKQEGDAWHLDNAYRIYV